MSKQQQDKITIYGPKADGTYIVEFKTTAGVPGSEAAVLKHFQAWMPSGLVLPDVNA
jgi:hypothetical protein